ncbi:transposase [Streptomyces sp. JCM17656]|nr:transposase [Streptomyces sp. JCM17656]
MTCLFGKRPAVLPLQRSNQPPHISNCSGRPCHGSGAPSACSPIARRPSSCRRTHSSNQAPRPSQEDLPDHLQELGRHRLQERRHRARRQPRNRLRSRQQKPGSSRLPCCQRRWVVERTIGWIMMHRCLARDYETLPASSEAMIHVAVIDLMSRRLTNESTPNWRDT